MLIRHYEAGGIALGIVVEDRETRAHRETHRENEGAGRREALEGEEVVAAVSAAARDGDVGVHLGFVL